MKLPKFISFILIFPLFSTGVFAGSLFGDVYDSDPVTDPLQYLLDEGIIEGYGDGTFRPLNLINRAEFTKMIVEGVAGISPDETKFKQCFPDVTTGWYAKYVCYAKDEGWISGYSDGDFRPTEKITRIEAVKILVEAYDWEKETDYSSYFYDIEPGSWYEPYLAAWESRGLFDKLGNQLSPHELISRRQMSEMLYRAMKYDAGEAAEIREITDGIALTYQEVLNTGIQPAFPPDMAFPATSQTGWAYGCYTFAVKNLMEFKYAQFLDVADVQKRIGWDGEFIWEDEEFEAFAREYNIDIIMNFNRSAEFLFKKLAMGEPMVMYMPYYSGGENIGHQVVAYSFDDKGVWIADSAGGYRHRLAYDQVFLDGANYTTNLTEIRLLGTAGQKKYEFSVMTDQ